MSDRRMTPAEERLLVSARQRLVDAWSRPGPHIVGIVGEPSVSVKGRLRHEWPALADALDRIVAWEANAR